MTKLEKSVAQRLKRAVLASFKAEIDAQPVRWLQLEKPPFSEGNLTITVTIPFTFNDRRYKYSFQRTFYRDRPTAVPESLTSSFIGDGYLKEVDAPQSVRKTAAKEDANWPEVLV